MNLPQKIVTKRLILKLLNQNQLEVFSRIVEDSDVIHNLKFILKVKSEKNAKNLYNSIIDSYNSIDSIIVLIIYNKESGNCIGSCGLIPVEDGNKAECFYTILPEYRGHGFAIEAMKKLFEYAFESLDFIRIIILIHPTNSRAWKVAERIGMKYLGHIKLKDNSSKMMYFSIDKAEFEAQGDY